jgi:predicted esterase
MQNPKLCVAITLALALPLQAAETRVSLASGEKLLVLVEKPKAGTDAGKELCILLPPGPGTKPMAQSAMAGLGKGFAARGWTVVSPVAPGGKAFFGQNASLVPQLARQLQKNAGTPGNRTLLAGISNGGIAALEVASINPELFSGVVAVPGLLRGSASARRLKGMPIFLRVGAKDDLKWDGAYPACVKQLERAGAVLDAKLLPNAGHGIVVNWTDLDAWLARAAQNSADSPRTAPLEAKTPDTRNPFAGTWTGSSELKAPKGVEMSGKLPTDWVLTFEDARRGDVFGHGPLGVTHRLPAQLILGSNAASDVRLLVPARQAHLQGNVQRYRLTARRSCGWNHSSRR